MLNRYYAIVGLVFAILVSSTTIISSTAQSIEPTPIPRELIPAPSTPPSPKIIDPLPIVPLLPPSPLYSINKVNSGLVAIDSLTNETLNKEQLLTNPRYWSYGGSATVQNSPFDIYKDSQGFHIGVQALSDGAWAGYYGVTPNTDATLFHSVITTDRRTIPNPLRFYNNGMYVQTAAISDVNYVTCFADTSFWGIVWAIFLATGNADGATQFTRLWYDPTFDQPLTRDCTIITNGNNYLKVYLDGQLAYENSTLNLQMPGPFNAFLEPQTSYAAEMQYGTYKDYYSAKSETVLVTNTPLLSASVKLVDSTGQVLASAPVVSGTANLTIGQYHMPLDAYIKVYDSNDIQLASTNSPVSIFGGDVYSVKLNLNLVIGK